MDPPPSSARPPLGLCGVILAPPKKEPEAAAIVRPGLLMVGRKFDPMTRGILNLILWNIGFDVRQRASKHTALVVLGHEVPRSRVAEIAGLPATAAVCTARQLVGLLPARGKTPAQLISDLPRAPEPAVFALHPVGKRVAAWFDDEKRYYSGTVVRALEGADRYVVAWDEGEASNAELREQNRTLAPGDADRWHYL